MGILTAASLGIARNGVSARCLVAGASIVLGMAATRSSPVAARDMSLVPANMARIATIDERYQSYNVEMAEIMGGNFWKPYARQGGVAPAKAGSPAPAASGALGVGQDASMYQKRAPIDLSQPRLRKLASAGGLCFGTVETGQLGIAAAGVTVGKKRSAGIP
jgi:hypothetical protein